MNWVLLTWPTMMAVCLVFAGIHAQNWLRLKDRNSASFAALCIVVALVALTELLMMHAASTQAYLLLLRSFYLAVQAGFVALVCFVWIYLKAGRRWLGWTAIAMRGAVTVGGMVSPNTLHFRELQAMESASFLGAPVMVPVGTQNPWLILAVLSNLALAIFLLDTTVTIWRQRGGRQALALGSALLFFVMTGLAISAFVGFGAVKMPLHVTLSFISIIVIMGAQLSQGLIKTVRLSRQLAEAENRLLASRQRLSLAAEAAKVGFWMLDPATMRFQGTPWAMPLFARNQDHHPEFTELLAAIHPDDRELVSRALADALQSSQLISVEYRMLLADGRVRWNQSAGGGTYAGSGDAMRLMGVTFDITDRKLAEQKVNQQREKAEHLSRVVTVSGLSGVLTHELRQPLARMLDSAKQALASLQFHSGQASEAGQLQSIEAHVANIVAINDRASQVIAKLRMLLRRSEPRPERLSLAALVEGVLLFLRSDLERRGVQLVKRFDLPMREIAADRVRMEQVVINLIVAACDAMADKPRALRQLSVVVRESDAGALIDVSCPLDRSHSAIPRASDAVSALRPAFAETGLAICRAIVDSHGGRIETELPEQGGIAWQVWLPFPASDN